MNRQLLRSPKEKMAGWMHLPRFIDKIRLDQASKLPADYQSNFCRGFDGLWLDAAGLSKETSLVGGLLLEKHLTIG